MSHGGVLPRRFADASTSGTSTDNAVVRWDGTTGRDLQDSGVLIDDSNAMTGLTALTVSGNISVTGTVDGRDVAADGTKLDTVETNADVTDATNVEAAGAVMDSDLPLVVASGGTGASSLTAYAVICGGTTATGTVQSIAGLGTSGQVLTSNGAGSLPTFQDSTGSTIKEYSFPAEGLGAVEDNFAPIIRVAGTNVNMFVRAFDDTTEEYANGKFLVPSEVDTSGTVTFRAYVTAATAAASKNIGLTFGHLALNGGEDWDPASPYTEEDTGAVAISATQDALTEVTWTETISNLGWAASDVILFRLSRDTGVTDDLTGDLYLLSFSVEIPRSG